MKRLKDLIGWLKTNKIIYAYLLIFLVLAFSVRGITGNPTAQTMNDSSWKENGPFELSPERGRFALLYSVAENKTFQFSLPVAQFATPDVGYTNGHYVSLFAPGVSFIVMPGYFIGKAFGASQFGTYATIAVFAFLNSILISLISYKLFKNKIFSVIASIVFLFATPAFTYAVSLFQHHISTFLILLSLYILIGTMRFYKAALVWLLIGIAVTVDYPNGLMMAPIGIYAFSRFFEVKEVAKKVVISFKNYLVLSLLVAIIPLFLFLQFNTVSFGNPLQLSGTVDSAQSIDKNGKPIFTTDPKVVPERIVPADKSAIGFFQTRNFLNGFYTHLFSPDRGIIVFTPVILFGLFGLLLAIRQGVPLTPLFLSVIGVNFLLYSMWGDPWGGWAFGSRYLVPSYAILSLYIPLFLQTFWNWKGKILIVAFYLVFLYSLAVNTLGALTSSRIPPQTEVLQLEAKSHHEEKYSFNRDIDLLKQNISKSFVFNTVFKSDFTASQYYLIIVTIIALFATRILVTPVMTKEVKIAQKILGKRRKR